MNEDSTDFGAGVVQHCSKLRTILWRGLTHLSSVCKDHLFCDSMAPQALLSASAYSYPVLLAVPKALGEALIS